MNFRDMGPFENLPYTHVNIGFYLSDPPGFHVKLLRLNELGQVGCYWVFRYVHTELTTIRTL